MEYGHFISLIHLLGMFLIVASIIVGVIWAITKKSTLEPIAFVLATAGGLLLAV